MLNQNAIFIAAWTLAIAAPLALLLLWFVRKRAPWRTLLVLALPYALGVWAFLIEPELLFVRHVAVADGDWRDAPLRIGVITDTHVQGPHMPPARMAAIVARMNAEKPDIVVLLGDYAVGHEPASMRAEPAKSRVLSGIAAFARLRAPLGVYGVIGNHDTWYGAEPIRDALRRAGVTVLENQGVAIARLDGTIWVGGLGDYSRRGAGSHIDAAIAGAPDDAPIIMLAHYPDVFPRMPDRVALTLVGHTHCGQVNLPFVGRLVHISPAAKRYQCGLYDEHGRKIYVSGGVGTSILPVRFGAPPEIAIVTLSAAP